MKITKSIFVRRPVDAAFRHFTAEIGRWWPLKEGFSHGGERANEIFIEGRVGGRFYERYTDGEESAIGRITVFEPPERVAFTWRHPAWNTDTLVEVRFIPEGDGTRVTLEHRGWESAGEPGRRGYDEFGRGWEVVLSRYAAGPPAHEENRMMKLHVFPPSPRALKVRALVRHLDLDVEECLVNLFAGEQKAPAYASLNPNQRMPVLEDGDFVLWESNAILQYLAAQRPESGLWPGDARGQADVSRWLHWESAHWTPACAPLAFERVVKKLAGLGDPDPAEIARAEKLFHPLAAVLNGHLRGRRWLLGDSLTIADFGVATGLAFTEAAELPVEPYHELVRWYHGFRALPGWQKALVPPQS
jgi:glutathione S-transferase